MTSPHASADRAPFAPPAASEPPAARYRRFALFVLVVVYVLNFLDRQILSILSERIKADLGLSDAQVGFLYGTAFAVFYALFEIPLGRLADAWDRRKLIAAGLAVWSLMTGVSGLAHNFTQLALARIGVGVGEASASPAAYSILADYYPARRRGAALAIYSSGIYIGAGLGLGIGGLIVNRWDAAWGGDAPLGLRGWQVAFFAVGVPGLLLTWVVRSLREPVRGEADGILTPPEPHPFREFLRELRAIIPPLNLLNLVLAGAGAKGLVGNLAAGAVVALVASLLTYWLGNPAQWAALGVGLYAAGSWAQSLALRDRACFVMVFRAPGLRYTILFSSCMAFVTYGIGFWTAPFFLRVHHLDVGRAGLILGGTAAAAGWLGAVLGGMLADRWRAVNPCGRLYLMMVSVVALVPLVVGMLFTQSTTFAMVLNFPTTLVGAMWVGVGASTVQDLVLPRMRATASATFLLCVTFIGLALGPYTVGRIGDAFGSLRTGMFIGLAGCSLVLVFLVLTARVLEREEISRLDRARAAGERGI